MSVCDKHAKNPAWGYDPCPGCEVERQREEIKQLKSEVERLTEDATKPGYPYQTLKAEVERLRQANGELKELLQDISNRLHHYSQDNKHSEVTRLVAERDRCKEALESFVANAYEQSHGASDYVVTTCEALEKAKAVLAEAAQPETTCESCERPLGDDAPLYEDADICRSCHEEIRAGEEEQG